jgi:hypothetical protein
MRPYKDINVGDVYRTFYGQLEYCVLEKDDSEKMILVAPLSELPQSLREPFWKKNTDKLFIKRVLKGIL